MAHETSTGRDALHFVTPRNRWALRVRAGVAALLASMLGLVTGGAVVAGTWLGASIGVVSTSTFLLLALDDWRRASSPAPPLVVDRHGVHIDDGLGRRWDVLWEEIRAVRLERSWFGRRIVLEYSAEPRELILPRDCCEGAPPEWMAGMLEMLREVMLRRPV